VTKKPETSEPSVSRATIAYRYTGGGDNLPGIPARDLTDEDVARLSDADKKSLIPSGIYVKEGKSNG
jgi:hypothetical protein